VNHQQFTKQRKSKPFIYVDCFHETNGPVPFITMSVGSKIIMNMMLPATNITVTSNNIRGCECFERVELQNYP